ECPDLLAGLDVPQDRRLVVGAGQGERAIAAQARGRNRVSVALEDLKRLASLEIPGDCRVTQGRDGTLAVSAQAAGPAHIAGALQCPELLARLGVPQDRSLGKVGAGEGVLRVPVQAPRPERIAAFEGVELLARLGVPQNRRLVVGAGEGAL